MAGSQGMLEGETDLAGYYSWPIEIYADGIFFLCR